MYNSFIIHLDRTENHIINEFLYRKPTWITKITKIIGEVIKGRPEIENKRFIRYRV